MKRLCTICVRGGSKGVPGKNTRIVRGRPLFVHSLEQARQTGLFAATAVSSESDEILRMAKEAGADHVIRRPDEMASDTAPKIPAIVHCVEAVEERTGIGFDVIVDLDATAPLRLPEDILGAVNLLETSGCGNVITGCAAHRSPYFNLVEVDDRGVPRLSKGLPGGVSRRQDAPPCFDMNASVYVWRRAALTRNGPLFTENTRFYEMPRERSLDIDSELDLQIVSFLMDRG